MNHKYAIGVVLIVIIVLGFGIFPNENTKDTKSVMRNVSNSYATNTLVDSSNQIINNLASQSENIACQDPNSNACNNTKHINNNAVTAFHIIIMPTIIGGGIGLWRWVNDLFN